VEKGPVDGAVRLVSGDQEPMAALSALLGDEKALRAITDEVGAACKARGVALLLGRAGAWQAQPSYGVRGTSCERSASRGAQLMRGDHA
jgi:hypothetical protein